MDALPEYADRCSSRTSTYGQGNEQAGTMDKLGVVLLNWNNSTDTIQCVSQLRPILAQIPGSQVVVVDNGSQDGSVARLQEEPDIHLIVHPRNRGFAAGVNAGIQWLLEEGHPAILVLNSDVVLPPGFLDPMVDLLARVPTAGIVSPKIRYLDPPNRLWYAGGRFRYPRLLGGMEGLGEEDRGQYDRTRSVDFVTGCCMLVRREVFETIGLFDEDFFFYQEDIDFCIRARAAGFESWFCPASLIWHRVSSSTETTPALRTYLYAHSRFIFFSKHIRGLRWFPVLALEAARWARTIAVALAQGQAQHGMAYTRGLFGGILWSLGWTRDRRGQDPPQRLGDPGSAGGAPRT